MAIKNPEKPEKTGSTARQEQCSLAAIYYAYRKGASLNTTIKDKKSREAQFELNAVLNKIYVSKIPKDWYNTFIEQAQVLCNFKLSSHKIGSTTTAYDYGWYDGSSPKGVAPADTTTLLQDIWDLFGPKVWKLFGGQGQKDSWNTADVFMVKKGQDKKILNAVKVMKKDFIDNSKTEPGVFVGSINTLLTQYVSAGILLPISLKAKTSGVSMTIKPTNMHTWDNKGSIDVRTASFIKNPWMYFNVFERKGKLDFGGGPNKMDGGNSLQYFAQFRVGDYETKYLIEQRMAGTGTKAEIKDIKLTNKGEDKRAAAQTGTVPGYKFRELIYDYTGEKEDDMVPAKTTHLNNPDDIKYWSDYLIKVMNDSTVPKSIGKFLIKVRDIDENYGGKPKEFIQRLFEIDEMIITNPKLAEQTFKVPVGDYGPKLRLKLKQLRFLWAMIQSKQKISELITHLYYLAAKQNISEADLNGPFLKIS